MIRAIATFLKSATDPSGFPKTRAPEVVFLGRSNVGKSSLINRLLDTKAAHVSSTPGHTTVLNFYEVTFPADGPGPHLVLTDAPGHGYAKRRGGQVHDWRVMMDDYLQQRPTLGLCVVMVDPNVPVQEGDKNLLIYLRDIGKRFVIVATKCDKLPSSRKLSVLRDLATALGGGEIIGFSATTGEGREDLWKTIRIALHVKKMA